MPESVSILSYLVIAAFVYAVAGIALALRKARSFGERRYHATPAGIEGHGIRYAFVEGMMPWEKDSARQHIVTYIGGVLYHLGVFAALLILILNIFAVDIGDSWKVTIVTPVIIGLLAGLGLFIKRLTTGYLRAISKPDDYIANLLVDLFLFMTAASVYEPSMVNFGYVSAILLLLYVPVGKIRHCFFFFVSRVTFGRYFGRRGVLPHAKSEMG